MRTAIVTGASAGIGLEIARGLAKEGYHVVLAVRDEAKGAAAAKEIGGSTEVMRVDVSDLESVRSFAAAFLARHGALHLLVNNAGIHIAEERVSPQGFELTMATNHLGHFLLTHLLLDALANAAPSRVVNVASEAHRFARGEPELRPRAGLDTYTRSKLANIMFTKALARRLEGTGVAALAAHPGSVRTGWARGKESGLFRFAAAVASPFLLPPARGARTPLHACLAPGLASGSYYVRMRPATPTRLARDEAAQERLWRASAEAVGLASAGARKA